MTIAFLFILIINCLVIFTADALLGAPPPALNTTVIVLNGNATGIGGTDLGGTQMLALAASEMSVRNAIGNSQQQTSSSSSTLASNSSSASSHLTRFEDVSSKRDGSEHRSVVARKGVIDPPAAISGADDGGKIAPNAAASVRPLNATTVIEQTPTGAPTTAGTATHNLRGDTSNAGKTPAATPVNVKLAPTPAPTAPSNSSTGVEKSTTPSTTSTTTTTTTTTTSTTTTTPKPTKPKITYSVAEDPNKPKVPPHPHPSVANTRYTTATSNNNAEVADEPRLEPSRELRLDDNQVNAGRRYVIPMVTLIFAVPMILGAGIVLTRRFRNYWSTRHYRRMDFLVDGMYNT